MGETWVRYRVGGLGKLEWECQIAENVEKRIYEELELTVTSAG